MTMIYEWNTGYCEYKLNDPAQPAGNVTVSELHWTCRARDNAVPGDEWVTSYDSVDATEQNRVYTVAALSNVPASVMTGWVKQALDNLPPIQKQSVADIEAALLTEWNNLQQPPSGGITPT